ncbi:peptidase [candidate division KSB1 bacterium]|nr:peptidase [candidate division KSB1 bacterium]
MTRVLFKLSILFLGVILMHGCTKKLIQSRAEITEVQAQLAKFAPVSIHYDASLLDENETKALQKIVAAAQLMDEIFLEQVYHQNLALRAELMARSAPEDQPYQQLFEIMFGPFNRLDEDRPFLNQALKPKGANFYPADLAKEEFLKWVADHPNDRSSFESNFTCIQRQGEQLVAVPYSQVYRQWLEPAARLLEEAAECTQNASLQKYLHARATAFLSNDYFQSDLDWMDLDSPIEVVIGPYEVYEDNLFNYKAAFEAFVTLVDPGESQKLATVAAHLDDLEQNFPLAPAHRNFSRGKISPIKVVQEVFSAGDTKAGVQTIAFNLPNDERVREAKGSKKVMLKNIAEAKFQKIYLPIAQLVLAEEELPKIGFEIWFTHVLMHEVTHGLGPGKIRAKDGSETTVQKMLKETYATLEECKADVGGMYTYAQLCNAGVFPATLEPGIYPTFLGGIFRSVRFGASEAHGKANMIAFNYITAQGGYTYDAATQKFAVDPAKIRAAVKQLFGEILTIQAEGNYAGAVALIEKYSSMPANMQLALAKLTAVPVDIRPEFQILEKME